MFGLFNKTSTNASKQTIFDEADVRQILQSFSLTESESNTTDQNPRIFLSTSGDAIIQADGIIKSLESWSTLEKGRRHIFDFAKLNHVDSKTIICLMTGKNDWAMITADRKQIISTHEQREIASRLLSSANESFIDEVDFYSSENLHLDSLTTILVRYKMQNELISIRKPSQSPLNDGRSFIISQKLRAKVYNDVLAQVTEAEKGAVSNGQEFHLRSTTLPGLPVLEGLYFYESIKAKENIIQGVFKIKGDRIVYVPKSYVSALRAELISKLQRGSVPFLDARKLVDELPGEFNDENAVLETITKSLENGKSVHVLDHYVFSAAWIEAQGVQVQKVLNGSKPVGQTDYCTQIPIKYQDDIWDLIIESLGSFDPYNIVGDYVVSKQWIKNIEQKTRDLAMAVAEQSWLDEEPPKSKSVIISKVKQDLRPVLEQGGADEELADMYIGPGQKELDTLIMESYNLATEKLETACDDQFRKLWVSRVVDNSRLYSKAIEAMDEGNIKTQLDVLLVSHVNSEVVPSIVNKAKTRKLMRSPKLKLSTRLSRLQTTLAETKQSSTMLQEIEKFNEKIGAGEYDEDMLKRKKTEHLLNMASSMSKDEDSVRLFICLLIILYSLQSKGILYATGKFAPRMLKLLKPYIDPEQAQWLEQVKDAVKNGNVTQDMKDTMKEMASKAAQNIP